MADDNNNCSLPSFEIYRVFGSSLSQERRWYALSSMSCGVKVSKFVKENFFLFLSHRDLSKKAATCGGKRRMRAFRMPYSEGEIFVATLFGFIGRLLKSSVGSHKSLSSWKMFHHVVSYINKIDVNMS